MKLKTLVVAGGAVAIGYLLGTRSGRAKFEELKARAAELAQDPRVQSGVSTVAEEVSKNADRLPPGVASVVKLAADKVHEVTADPTPPRAS